MRGNCNHAFELSQARDYLAAACEFNAPLDVKREALVGQLNFDALLNNPHLIAARLDSLKQWKGDYVQVYRKGHRAHFESLRELGKAAEPLRSRAIALSRLNGVVELGPPHPGTADINADFERLQEALWLCQTPPRLMWKVQMLFDPSANGSPTKLSRNWSMTVSSK